MYITQQIFYVAIIADLSVFNEVFTIFVCFVLAKTNQSRATQNNIICLVSY